MDMMRPLVLQVNPTPPVLAATIAGPPAAVALTWTGVASNVTGFQVQRAPVAADGTIGTFTNRGGVLAGNVTTYTDTAVTLDNTYAYQVMAQNGTNGWYKSDPSNAVIVRVAVPLAPSNLTAVASALSLNPPTVTLNWVNNDTNAASITIERAENAGFTGATVTTFTVAANATTYTDTTVANVPTTYYYRVQASNVLGNSPWSGAAAVADPGQLPAAPVNLTVTVPAGTTGQRNLDLAWAPNPTPAGPVTDFVIQRSTAGATGPWTTITTVPGTTTTYRNSGLNQATTYWYQVQATNAAGGSAFTPAASGTTR